MSTRSTPARPIPGYKPMRRLIFFVGKILRLVLLRASVSGLENIPAHGPVVIVINHITVFDPVVVWMLVSRIVIPLAKIEAYSLPFFGWVMNVGGSIPVQRDEVDTSAIKSALRVLKEQECILLAPEGTRSRTGQLQEAKDGAAMLALRSDAQILPVAVTGTEHFTAHWRRWRRAPVKVVFGQPFKLEVPPTDRLSREAKAALTDTIMIRVAQLLPPEYHGIYAGRV